MVEMLFLLECILFTCFNTFFQLQFGQGLILVDPDNLESFKFVVS